MGEKQVPLSLLSSSPSFNSYSANRLGEIADRVINELAAEQDDDDSQDGRISAVDHSQAAADRMTDNSETAKNAEATESGYDSDDFEFTFLCRDPDSSPISADEIFSNGQIRPIFPVFNRDFIFNDSASSGGIGASSGGGGVSKASRPSVRIPLRKLLLEDRDPATSSTELEDIPAGSYCVWTPRSVPPSPDRCKKSNSTGSSKRWRLKNLLHRSSSDGKETFLFLSPAATGKEEAARVKKVNSGKGKVGPVASAHEMHYVRNRASKDADRRRSFLPYRPDIVGFFANVNGLSRNLHPF